MARRGKKRALIAVGHKILLAAYYILKDRVKYVELGGDYLVKRQSSRQLQNAVDKLSQLGYKVQLKKKGLGRDKEDAAYWWLQGFLIKRTSELSA